MKQELQQEVETLAGKILRAYFCDCDIEFMVSTFADDIVWIGAGEKQRAEGKEAVSACFQGKGMIPCHMSGERYVTLELGEHCFLCEADSWIQPREETEMYFRTHQRATFIFEKTASGYRTKHIHNSVDYADIHDDELFPVRAAEHAYKELQEALYHKDQEVVRQARFLGQLYNSVPCGILQFTPDREHRIININRMVWEFYGFSSEQEYRSRIQDPFQLVFPEERERISKIIAQMELGGGTITYSRRCRKVNGEPAWINVIMERLVNANGIEVIQAIFTDITQMKALQQAQEEERLIENQSLRAATYIAYPLIMRLNLTKNTYNCFIEGQECYYAKRGGKLGDMGEKTASLIHPSYRQDFMEFYDRQKILDYFSGGGQELYMETQIMGEDQKYHWISIHLIYVENPVSTDILAIELVKLLDEQRAEQARQELLLREALAAARAASEAKTDFLSRMSHDIRTPMNAIIGMSTIGQLKIQDRMQVQECFRKIDASSRFLLSLINDILDMSRIENGKININKDKFDLQELIEELITIVYPQARQRGIIMEVLHEEPLEQFYIGDSLRIKQVIMNLLSNALKFTPAKGSIILRLQEERRTNGYACLKFQVEDSGIGMSEEFMKVMFQPFEQESSDWARNNAGNGLGLSIVYSLVQLMGGTITVHSKKNQGTAFEVMIPVELTEDDEEAEQRRKAQELMKQTSVLVVDDDEIVGQQTTVILEDIGASVEWVDSGRKAVERVKAAMSRGTIYDIAMVDWRMPDMDGIETTRRIRELTGPDTMIIIISAYDWSTIEEEARNAGANFFISKPLFRKTIYHTLNQLKVRRQPMEEEWKEEWKFDGKHVLLVEDNELNCEIAKVLLEESGMQVETAENGRIALEKFAASSEGFFLAVLMDIRMPVMNGLEATRAIRALDRPDAERAPIIAMTANAFEEDKKAAYESGMTGYLVKPLDIHRLLDMLEKM